jgi:hypothetical protein
VPQIPPVPRRGSNNTDACRKTGSFFSARAWPRAAASRIVLEGRSGRAAGPWKPRLLVVSTAVVAAEIRRAWRSINLGRKARREDADLDRDRHPRRSTVGDAG